MHTPCSKYEIRVMDAYDRAVLQSLLLRYERDDSVTLENMVHTVRGGGGLTRVGTCMIYTYRHRRPILM
jgi:hypothetical protein